LKSVWSFASTIVDDIETSFQAAIDAGRINGAVICASDAEGRVIYGKALGERTLLSGEKRPQRLGDVLYLLITQWPPWSALRMAC
jgi:hypothetical protein